MYTLVIGNKNYSSWSLRAWLLLSQFKIPFTELRLALHSNEFKENIGKYSPTGLVPVLRSGDQSVWDSLAICEYIAEHHPDLGCWPADGRARAVARSVSCEMHSGFFQLRNSLPMNCRRKKGVATISPELRRDIVRVCEIWRSCRKSYGDGGDFLFGEFSIADAMYAPVVLRFNSYLIEVGEVEAGYMQAMLALASLQRWIDGAVAEKEVIDHYEHL